MIRTSRTPKRTATPRPGAAKLNLSVDQELEKNAARITRALIAQATSGNPTCLHLLIRWAENAEFAQQCIDTYGSELVKWIDDLEKELKELEEEEARKAASLDTATPGPPPPAG